jgi:1,2-diacylglycerol 3-alpha-glucosyltransferase
VARDNGRLLVGNATVDEFATALEDLTSDPRRLRRLCDRARASIEEFSLENCAGRLVELYGQLAADARERDDADPGPWDRMLNRLEIEWNLLAEKATALAAAVES